LLNEESTVTAVSCSVRDHAKLRPTVITET
jgi:hypothetical protein